MQPRSEKVTRLTIGAMLCTLAYLVMLVGRVPVVLFLKYDPKDVVIAIGGFLMGPLSAAFISLIVSFIEMFTVSDNGIIGFIMNVISTCAFVCPAAFLYKRKRTISGAAIGLVIGCVLMTISMMVWNYLITPFYMVGTSRAEIGAMLVPYFLPFNLLKSGLNAAFTMLLYKPVITALRKANLIPQQASQDTGKKIHLGALLTSALILITCILAILVMNGTI